MKPLIVFFAWVASAVCGYSADWPQFRGPEGTGVIAGAALPLQPSIQWTAPLPGRGLASPIVIGDRVFVTSSSGPKQDRLHLLCFRVEDGSRLWARQLLATGRTMTFAKTSVAACTPCSDGKHVFALWSCNDLAAFDLEGNLLWVRGLTSDYPNASNSLGMASSPVVVGQTLVVQIENDSESYSLGIEVSSGRNLWKLDRPKAANWSSPVIWRAEPAGSPLVVLQSTKGLVAVDPSTGSPIWEFAGGASSMSSSVVAHGIVYASANGITALGPKPNEPTPTTLWNSRQINPATVSPVVLKEKIFSLNGAGILSAAELKAGEIKWKLRLTGPFSSSPIGTGSLLALVNEKGLLQIVDVDASEGALVASLQLPLQEATKELVLGTPALVDSALFIRTDSALWRVGNSAPKSN